MTYYDRETVPYGDPKAPGCDDDEAQRLRDLWRPAVQATWQPRVRIDPDSADFKNRDGDYDTTQASLWADYPMYVIPPAIAGPLETILDEQREGPMFETRPDWEGAVLHGATRFMEKFLWQNRFGGFSDKSRGQAQANFDESRTPTGFLASGFDKFPSVSIPAPVLERQITHRETTSGEQSTHSVRVLRGERQAQEGILGWTVPITSIDTGEFAFSLLRAKKHLVGVHWFAYPRENLSLTFRYPQLTHAGEAMLGEAIAELGHLVPEGTDYSTLYGYHPRLSENDYPRDAWRDTDEDRSRRQAEYDKARDDWLRSRPRVF